MSLAITWGEPVAQGAGIVGYSVECQRVDQSPSRELMPVPLTPPYDAGVEETQAQVTQGLGMKHLILRIPLTVEPPITDSPRYRPPPYNGQTMCP